MKKYFPTAAALSALCFLAGFTSPAFSAPAQKSQNGLFPDEIVSADQLKKMLDKHEKFIMFDARDKRSFDSAHIQGAALPRTEDYYRQEELFRTGLMPKSPDPDAALKEAVQKFTHDMPIVTYCNSNCHASSALALKLKGLGFTNVRSMEEGVQAWEKKEYPVIRAAGASGNLTHKPKMGTIVPKMGTQ